ncbi:MAG: cbb3-type cytochrome c oxidase subunit I [Janthinobacterium lividum]
MSITSLLPSDTNGSGPPVTAGKSPRLSALWDRLDRPDSAALHGLFSGAFWIVMTTIFGFIMSNELTTPDIFAGIPQLVFSRMRPAHIAMGLFGIFSAGMFGGWYFIVPRLCKTPLRSNRAANLLLIFWNLAVLLGVGAILNGDTQGKEYTEFPWWIDWPVFALMCVNAVIIFQTIAARREPKMYVSLWYIGGSVVWVAMMYFIGNVMWHPFDTYLTADGHKHILWNNDASNLPDGVTDFQRTGSLRGLNDAIWNWFYGHNLFGLFITTGGIALVYYLVPKLSRRPLYSHLMSLIGFWSIALLYSNTGQHHLLQAPIPNWLKIISIVGSVGLIIPVFSFSVNIYMTMRGQWGQMLENIPLRFVLTGSFFYLAVSFQGTVQAFMTVNRFVHFTQWVIAHSHLAFLGAFAFISSATMLYMVPQIVRKPLWSRNLADTQYWLMLIGVNGYFWALTAAGLAQGSAWVTLGEQVVKAYPIVKPYFLLRSVFGGMFMIGVMFQFINLVMTIRQKMPTPAQKRNLGIAELQEIGAPASEFDDRVAVVD